MHGVHLLFVVCPDVVPVGSGAGLLSSVQPCQSIRGGFVSCQQTGGNACIIKLLHSGGGVLSVRNVFSRPAPCAEGFGLRLAVRFGHGQESGLCLAFRLLEGGGVALGFRGGALGGLLEQRIDVNQFRQFVAFFNDDGRRSRGRCGLFRGVQLVQCLH